MMDALRKMSLMPAQRLERATAAARKKGRLQEGADADIVVFDPRSVTDRASPIMGNAARRSYRGESWRRIQITQRSSGPRTCSLVGANGSQYGVYLVADEPAESGKTSAVLFRSSM